MSLQNRLSAYRWGAVILGLGMGERLEVPREIKDLMRETGTLHLMAISGLHIALAASLVWLLAWIPVFITQPRPQPSSPCRVNLCCFLRLAYRSATACAEDDHRPCGACSVADYWPSMVSLAGLELLHRGDTD